MYQCPLCHQLDSINMFCELCMIGINAQSKQKNYCTHCGKEILAGNICGFCSSHQVFIEKFWASYYYKPPVSKLIQEWKFYSKIQYSKALGQIMLLNPPKWMKNNPIQCIIAMPSTNNSYRHRLFNQSVELASVISQKYHIPIWYRSAITKHNQKAQHDLSQKERIRNIKNCFTIHQIPEASSILIIDDVATTLATLNELARCLKNKRDYQIFAWVLAQ